MIMCYNKSMKKRGFTLLEAVLYLAIAGTVIYFISGFAFNAIFGKAKIETIQEMSEGSQSVLDQISSAISNASEINGLETDGPWVSQIPTNGLVSYWPFTGNADDAVGGNNGTIYGATATTGVKGITNTAYAFNGVNDYINAGDNGNTDIGLSDFTVAGWVKTTTGGSYKRLLDKNYSTGYCVFINGNRLGMSIAGLYTNNINGKNLNDGEWHHIVVVFNRSTNAVYYVDGVTDGTPTNISSKVAVNLNNATNLWIGYGTTPDGLFNGSIDQVRIYNRALTSDEVLAIYNEEKP